MIVRAMINKETLRFIREHIGITIPYIKKTTKFDEEKYTQWESVSSGKFPTCNQAKEIAKCFRIPFAGLYMQAKDIKLNHIPKIYNMRTLYGHDNIDDSSINLAIIDLLNYRELLIETKTELKEPIMPFTLSINGEDIKHWATSIRELFALDLAEQYKLKSKRQFYLYVRKKIEERSLFVHSFSGVDTDVLRGIALYNDIFPVIGINDDDRYPAKTFSIIHELVHIFKRSSTMCNDMFNSFSTQQEEIFCNAVAGEVLVPHEALSTILKNRKINEFTEDVIGILADVFSVSKEVVLRRLFDSRRISRTEYDTFLMEFKRTFELEKQANKDSRERLKAEGRPSVIPRNISRETIDKNSSTLCQTLYQGYGEGIFDRQDIARYLRIDQKHISKFLMEVSRWDN